MVRTHDIMIPSGTSWISDPAAKTVCAAVQGAGYDLYFVGGCVRNALLGLPDSDVDMSTNALPEKVMEIARGAGFKAIPTGIDHGTVTVVAQGKPFEITTFRRDVETDGRRAVVAFSQDIADDARRRDFTMNALYATADSALVDPLNGLPDLLARRVRFIEDPSARIQEDYLRILRFFRFSAWYADPSEGFEAETLAAISANSFGLETLSAERVGQEMAKLLSAPDPAPAIAVMRQIGVLHQILPGSDDRVLALVIHHEQQLNLDPHWINRLAVLGGAEAVERLRLSNADARHLAAVVEAAYAGPALAEIAYRSGAAIAQAALMIRAALAETEVYSRELETISKAATERFPISAKDLMPDFQGPALGEKLKELEDRWIASDFTLTARDLLA